MKNLEFDLAISESGRVDLLMRATQPSETFPPGTKPWNIIGQIGEIGMARSIVFALNNSGND
jgi:hypothetical protein